MRRFKFLRDPAPDQLGDSAERFIERYASPLCVFLEGEDPSRTRAFVTLSHGNEPSGLLALFRWLKSGRKPAVNVVCIVASVAAALEEPRFTHRMLPRARDLNRCFRPPFDDAQGALAQEMLEILKMHHPEAVVDMHNTSGSGPAFGVCTFEDRQHDALVSLFTRRLIISNLDLGALMDISEYSYPTVTVEVGGREDDAAHELAWEGLCRYFEATDVFAIPDVDWGLELLHNPIRLELCDNVTLTYDEAPQVNYDVTLRKDIEHHNFGTISPDTALGWAEGPITRLFSAQDMGGRCALAQIVRLEDGLLYPARPLKLFMITTNATIAESDCLFYAVGDDGSALRVTS